MSDWSISRRIATITLSLLGALALVSAVTLIAVLNLGAAQTASGLLMKKGFVATDMAEDLFQAEAAETAYRRAATDAHAQDFHDNLAEVLSQRDAILDLFSSDSVLTGHVQSVLDGATAYAAAFDSMRPFQSERELQVAELTRTGDTFLETMNRAHNAIVMDGDRRSAEWLNGAIQSYLLSRTQMERYLLTNDPAEFESSKASVIEAKEDINRVLSRIDGTLRADTVAEGTVHLDAFWIAAEAAKAAITARNAIRDELDSRSDMLHQDIETIVDEVVARQATLAADSSRMRLIVLALAMGVALVSLAGGFALARWISAGIIRSIAGSVDTMTALAKGELDVEIAGTEAQTELGDIARALVVFRDTACESRELEARNRAAEQAAREREEEQARRDQEAQAARQKEAAEERRRMLLQLREGLGGVVDAAAEGDFSHRIDTQFDEVELDEMARGINRLVENVQSGVAETARVMAAMAGGDLTDRMHGNYSGIFGELQANVNGTIENLAQLVSEIARQCDGLSTEVESMTNQSGDLARRAEQQAASLEETSAVMEEMSASAKSSAEGARGASGSADNASRQVGEAGSVVSSAVAAMGDIRDASQRIGDIVSVIDGIAFQTNLLALNASVEAARAGSAGKGFAVVATEVRALAQRSSEASQDIKTLIDESTQQVTRGVELVERTGATLDEIVGGVSDMAKVMQDLSTSALEQATGVQEATSAISQMDVITQKNAALADESRETAARVRVQAQTMQNMVMAFRTSADHADGSGAGAPTAVAAE